MPAVPYCGPAPLPGAAAGAWNFDPLLLAALTLGAWLLRQQPRASWAGLGLLALAYVSPICALGSGLFSVRVAHHLLVVYAAAPLLAGQLARLPADLSKVPLFAALVLHVAVMWAWHIPLAYSWALSSDLAYWLGQAALLGSAMLFWYRLADTAITLPAALLAIIAMTMQMGLLGALLTFAPAALYAPHYLTTGLYGLTPLADQQLAGLLMWTASLPLTVLAGYSAVSRLLHGLRAEPAS